MYAVGEFRFGGYFFGCDEADCSGRNTIAAVLAISSLLVYAVLVVLAIGSSARSLRLATWVGGISSGVVLAGAFIVGIGDKGTLLVPLAFVLLMLGSGLLLCLGARQGQG